MNPRVQIQDAIAKAVASFTGVPEDLVAASASFRPEEDGHSARWEIFLEPIEMQRLELCYIRVQVDAETGDLILEMTPEIRQEREPFSAVWYSVYLATKRSDGTISIPAGGANDQGIWDGHVTIEPDSNDYEFWLWVLKRWTYRSILSSEDIPALEEEFAKARA